MLTGSIKSIERPHIIFMQHTAHCGPVQYDSDLESRDQADREIIDRLHEGAWTTHITHIRTQTSSGMSK